MGKPQLELTDSSGFEFNTTRPRSQCALEYNTSWSQSDACVLTEEIRYMILGMSMNLYGIHFYPRAQ